MVSSPLPFVLPVNHESSCMLKCEMSTPVISPGFFVGRCPLANSYFRHRHSTPESRSSFFLRNEAQQYGYANSWKARLGLLSFVVVFQLGYGFLFSSVRMVYVYRTVVYVNGRSVQ